MKILVAGGWGYNNLGDDAILIASIKLLNASYPEADIVITSYNPIDTKQILTDYIVTVIPSIQCLLFGNFVYSIFCSPEKWTLTYTIQYKLRALYQKIKNDISYLLIDQFPKIYINSVALFYPTIKKQFENVDLFLMSGGGYLNESKENNISHFLEITFAKNNNIPVKLIGQTIGPFENLRTKRLMKRYLPKADSIVVRDIESKQELSDMGIPVDQYIIPDLALYDISSYTQTDVLTIIPFFGLNNRINDIVSVLTEVARTHNLKIVITVSQLWTQPILLAKQLETLLRNNDIGCTLMLPKDVFELQEILGKSKIVISQNLHGLIMAYRSGAKIVSLNDKRKFKTFFEVIYSAIPCFSINDFDKNELLLSFNKVYNIDGKNNKKEISAIVASKFEELIKTR